MSSRQRFASRYGPVALVAGAAEGLGAAFSRALARAGLDLLLVDVRGTELRALARELEHTHGVRVVAVELDLGAPNAATRALEAAGGLEIGLLVYNAAYAIVGPFLAHGADDQTRVVDVNVRGALALTAAFVPAMATRGRGGVLLVGSAAGLIGHPLTAVYGASKAFLVRLGEALEEELRPRGVDVLVACPGAVRTPGFVRSGARLSRLFVAEPEDVAEQALRRLGSPSSTAILGLGNRLALTALGQLPRRVAVRLLGKMMRSLYRPG